MAKKRKKKGSKKKKRSTGKKKKKKGKKKKGIKKKSKKSKPKKKKSKKKRPKSSRKTAPKKRKVKKALVVLPPEPEVEGTFLGKVEDFFAQVGVIALTLEASLNVGDTIRVKSENTDFTQTVNSIQIEHDSVQSANRGDAVGIKVSEKAHRNNRVYKV